MRMFLVVFNLLKNYLYEADESLTEDERKRISDFDPENRTTAVAVLAVSLQKLSENIAQNGYVRALFTSDLVGKRIRAVTIDVNPEIPALSTLQILPEVRFKIDVLKHLTYELHIKS
jgi:hypothetical protein